MSGIHFNVPLTQEENKSYCSQFKSLDKEDLGVIIGETLKSYFVQSGLSSQQLSQIWSLVDTKKQGFLNLEQFEAALRLIGHVQGNNQVPITRDLYQTPPVTLANFIKTVNIPPISHHDQAKFSQIFDRLSEDGFTISGAKAKSVFLKAKLTNMVLGSIWTLCDRNNLGVLDKTEFIVAMHLIQLTLNKHSSVLKLPSVLPQYLWSLTLPTATESLSNDSTGLSTSSSIERSKARARLSLNSFNSVSSDWGLSYEKKQQFDSIFDALDKNKAGELAADILVPFFLTSKLSHEVLALVWDLADIHNSPVFTKVEFAIAMLLIHKKNAGVDLPNALPDQLLESPSLGLYKSSNHFKVHQKGEHGKTSHFSIPSKEDKPHFEHSQIQNTTKLPFTELLGVDSDFGSHSTRSDHLESKGAHLTGGIFTTQQPQLVEPDGKTILNKPNSFRVSDQRGLSEETQGKNSQKYSIDENMPVGVNSSSPLSALKHRNLSYTSTSLSNFEPANSQQYQTSKFKSPQMTHPSKNLDNNLHSHASGDNTEVSAELNNLSNQFNSLNNQVTLLNETKIFTQQELDHYSEMKASIDSKFSSLRGAYEKERLQVEELKIKLTNSRKENESLTQELATVELDYQNLHAHLAQLKQELENVENSNAQARVRIEKYNSISNNLRLELIKQQQNVKQATSMADINSKEAKLSDITVSKLQAEIQGLDEKMEIFTKKRKELDEYSVNIEKQYHVLEHKHKTFVMRSQELENKYKEFGERERDFKERTKQLDQQEQLYQVQISKLQERFRDFEMHHEICELVNLEQKPDSIVSEKNLKIQNQPLYPPDVPKNDSQNKSQQLAFPAIQRKYSEDQRNLLESFVPHDKYSEANNVSETHPQPDAKQLESFCVQDVQVKTHKDPLACEPKIAAQKLGSSVIEDEYLDAQNQSLKYSDTPEKNFNVASQTLESPPIDVNNSVSRNHSLGFLEISEKHSEATCEKSAFPSTYDSTSVSGVSVNSRSQQSYFEHINDAKMHTLVFNSQDRAVSELETEIHSVLPHDEEGKQDSVFDKDFPTSTSQTEIDEEDPPITAESAAQALDESDMNAYRMPRSESITSSTTNNAPQSVRDEVTSDMQVLSPDVDDHDISSRHNNTIDEDEDCKLTHDKIKSTPERWDEFGYNNTFVEPISDISIKDPDISGVGFSRGQIAQVDEDHLNTLYSASGVTNNICPTSHEPHYKMVTGSDFPIIPMEKTSQDQDDTSANRKSTDSDISVVQHTNQDSSVTFNELKSDQLQEIHTNEAESMNSISITTEERGKSGKTLNSLNVSGSTADLPADSTNPKMEENVKEPVELEEPNFTFNDHDFADLEQAYLEDEEAGSSQPLYSFQDFESVENTDLETEFSDSGFTGKFGIPYEGLNKAVRSPTLKTSLIVKRNGCEVLSPSSKQISQPISPSFSYSNKDLAFTEHTKVSSVEELKSMGFNETEAIKALKSCNWDLETATNILLDSNKC